METGLDEQGFTFRIPVRRLMRLVVACAIALSSTTAIAQSASGPLRVHPTNPRYFADAQNRAVYLTGSHTWANLQDRWTGSYSAFDFEGYLDMLEDNNHNFIRLWRWELPAFRYGSEPMSYASPHPWKRTGPGNAGDGLPRFNLNEFDQSYFNRLRQRCIAAGQRGMYVSIMLFEGHGLSQTTEGWHSHPFNSDNNINGIDGDTNNDGRGLETHTLAISSVTALQQAYVRKVIDTVNDLDNVMYEISNESHSGSVPWQAHFINYIMQYQSGKPQQHLVWLSTTLPNIDEELWDSAAQVISPGTLTGDGVYRDNPPPNDGDKIIINDTDHLWGCGGNTAWIWKSFTRGLHPIYMDGWDHGGACTPNSDMREQMGHTRLFAARMNLANAVPSGNLSSTGWCLADVGDAYLAYAPSGGSITLNLAGASGADSMNVEWFNPATGQTFAHPDIEPESNHAFSPPFSGPAVLFVYGEGAGGGMPGDANGDGAINVDDMILVFLDWGACTGCSGDVDGNGTVNVDDLIVVIMNWG